MTELNDAEIWRLDPCIVPPGVLAGGTCAVSGREGHHGADVVRVRAGDIVRLIDGAGGEALARVDAVGGGSLTCAVVESRTHDRGTGVSLTIAQALLKGRSFDDVVRRTSELGVAAVQPLETRRAIGRIPHGALESRLERWRGIAAAAVKQSRGVFLPDVAEPLDVAGLAARVGEFDLVLVAWEDESGVELIEALRGVREPHGERETSTSLTILLVVGPEGGLAASEVSLLKDAGAVSVSAGRRVLKADWAASAIAAMISCEVGGLLP